MKTAGWICVVLGILSMIGAASKGDGLIGPTFVMGLGVFFLYRASHKEQEQKNSSNVSAPSARNAGVCNKRQDTAKVQNVDVSNSGAVKNTESLDEIQSQLTLQQREAAMCLISFFGGFNNDLEDETPMMIFRQASIFFGMSDSAVDVAKIMAKYSDADVLIDTVLTIKNTKAKEFLLLSCYDLIKNTGNNEAYELLSNIANDMGYDKPKLHSLIAVYS